MMKAITSSSCLTVEPSKLTWTSLTLDRGGEVQLQMYFDGADGGPEALRVRISEGYETEPHFHLAAQFQLLLKGSLQFPDHRLDAPAVHYTDHSVPYGPFKVSEDHEMLILRPKPAGMVLMKDKTAMQQANPSGRELTRSAHDVEWEPLPGHQDSRRKILLLEPSGLMVEIVECAPGVELTPAEIPTYGRYEIVTNGSALVNGELLGPESLRFVQGNEPPTPLRCGPEGATVMVLTYDQDAERSYGGSTAQDIADFIASKAN
jgi:hypothetical protein